jgi:hypothetical protein
MAESVAWTVFGVSGSEFEIKDVAELAALFEVYGAGFSAVFLCMALLYWNAYRKRHELDLDAHETYGALFYGRHYLILVAVGLLSIAAAWLGIGVGIALPGWLYGFLGPLCAWHGFASARRWPEPTVE